MHFVIASTMMKYPELDNRSLYDRARHICQAADLIRERVSVRRRFRDLLYQAARNAAESGARPTALSYYENCVALLQAEPWMDGAPDVDYNETLDIYTRAAEIYCYQGQSSEALPLLASTFANARSAADRAASWLLQSRILSQQGDSLGSFNA